ncbi:OsmC family protein [Gordonia sp. CPCC 205333]|uniref:OsmC family protein n=1 Tax=Gordonia sp. CPCC 205333 TaxID=3140790 RepID=UPI003AF34BE2
MGTQVNHDEGTVNGISGEDRTVLVELLSDARRVKEFSGPWSVECAWTEGFKSSASVRGHSISFDQPGDVRADDTAPTPHEYMLSAVGSCVLAGVVLHATVVGVQLHSLRVSVSGTFENTLKWAGLESSGSPGYRSLEVHGAISGDAEDSVLQDIWDRALSGSPVAHTVHQATPVSTALSID